jgi:hypothetical protein
MTVSELLEIIENQNREIEELRRENAEQQNLIDSLLEV